MEKLDTHQKAFLQSILPQDWAFFYAPGVLVVYEEVPDLELVRKIVDGNLKDREIWVEENKFILTFVSKELLHWAGEGLEAVRSSVYIKGIEHVAAVFAKDYQSACKVCVSLKKKMT